MRQTFKLLLCLLLTSCSVQKYHQQDTTILHQKSNDDLQKIAAKRNNKSVLLLLPLSGKHKQIGRHVLQACLIANLYDDVDVYVRDTSERLDVQQLKSQMADKNVCVIIGPVFADESKKVASAFPNIPILSLSNNVKINHGHVVACGISPQQEIRSILKYARSKNKNGIVVVLPKHAYNDALVSIFQTMVRTDDELLPIRYTMISKLDATQAVNESEKQILFALDPIIDLQQLDESIMPFTLCGKALSNRTTWRNWFVPFTDNDYYKMFVYQYTNTYNAMPDTIEIVGYDIMNAVNQSLQNASDSLIGCRFFGCLGEFWIDKRHGLMRELEMCFVNPDESVTIAE